MSKAFSSLKTEEELTDRITFGMHIGKTWAQVIEFNPDYIIWCVGNTDVRFSYDLIVSAIKAKYLPKKPIVKAEIKAPEQDNYAWGSDWDDDIPF